MKKSNTCPKCGSHDILANVHAVDRAHHHRQEEATLATFMVRSLRGWNSGGAEFHLH